MRKPFKLTHLVTVAALFAGLFVGSQMGELAGPASAHAAPQAAQPDSEPPFNSAEQRKRMIAQLTEMNQRLTRIETKLASGISVKVTEMPTAKVKESGSNE